MERGALDDTETRRPGDAETSRPLHSRQIMNEIKLDFQLSRRDLYRIIRIIAGERPFRKVAMPGLAGLVFLGHALDGNYGKGLVWAVLVAFLYWGVSQVMFLLHVYGAGNATLLVPQILELHDDKMVVTSEHSREEFMKPETSDVRVFGHHVVMTTNSGKLVFLERSFDAPGDYQKLKNWLMAGVSPRHGAASA